MSARSLRRQMDKLHDQGQRDGLQHDARDPGWFGLGSKDAPYLRMAYNAGHEQGRRLRQVSSDLAATYSMSLEEASAALGG